MPRPIVHASVEFGADAWGGIASAIQLMARADAGERSDVVVITPSSETAARRLGDNAEHLAISVPDYPSGGDVYRAVDRVQAGRRISAEFQRVLLDRYPDSDFDLVVHNEELLELIHLFAHEKANIAYYSHGLANQEHPHEPHLHELQEQIIATEVPIAVVSDSQAQLLRTTTQARAVHVVRPPLRLLIDEARSQRLVHRPPAVPTLLLAGRVVPQKGIDLFLQAMEVVDGTSFDRCDLYVGHGIPDYERRCRKLAVRSAVPVRWHPWASREHLWQAMIESSAVVVPSRFEPLGLVAAESIAVGVPVVGAAVGGLAELIAHSGGHAVPAGPDGVDPEILANYLMRASIRNMPADPKDALALWSPVSYLGAMSNCLAEQTGI